MSFNSLTQFFMLPSAIQCAAIDLSFAAAGGDVIVSLGAVDDAGMPAPALVQKRIARADVKTDGANTRVLWDAPTLLAANTRFAITVSSADDTTAMNVGQVGEKSQSGGWVTAAQAAIGELLAINPSGIATRYANRMLKFDLLAVQYAEKAKSFEIGRVAVQNATSLLINAGAMQPESEARITYTIDLLDGGGAVKQSIAVDTGQDVQLTAPFTGTARVSATLRVGPSGLGAVLEPGTVLAVGGLLNSGTYISTAIATAGGTDARVIFEADIPGGSGVVVHAQMNDAGAWVQVPWEASSPQTTGTVEMRHRLQNINAQSIRLRLTLTGTTIARPKVRNLRAAIL